MVLQREDRRRRLRRRTAGALAAMPSAGNVSKVLVMHGLFKPAVMKDYPEYNPDQQRGEDGKWVDQGGGGDATPSRDSLNVRGLSNEELEHRIQRALPPEFEISVYGAGAGRREVSIDHERWVPGSYDRVANIGFSIRAGSTLTADLFEAYDTAEGRAAASAIMRVVHRMAVDSEVTSITTESGLTMGGYLWPRLGFDLETPAQANELHREVYGRMQMLAEGPIKDRVRSVLYAHQQGDLTLGTQLANLNDPLPRMPELDPFFNAADGGNWLADVYGIIRGKPTLGKLMLARTAYKYRLPRAKFDKLKILGGTRKALSKGYPEYNPDQPRDQGGRFAGGSGKGPATLSSGRHEYGIHQELRSRFPGKGMEIKVYRLDKEFAKIEVGQYASMNALEVTVPNRRGTYTGLEGISADNTPEGRRFARKALQTTIDIARMTGSKEIALTGVMVGAYLWPKIGFELDTGDWQSEAKGARDWLVRSSLRLGTPSISDRISTALSLLPQDKGMELVAEAMHHDRTLPHRLANLDYQLTPQQYKRISGYDPQGKPTLGKALLIETGGMFRLPRAKFGLLQRYAIRKVLVLLKGYPEYDDAQARGEDGKWTAGGGGSVAALTPAEISISDADLARFKRTGVSSAVNHYTTFSYEWINQQLRRGTRDRSEVGGLNFLKLVEQLDEFSSSARTTKEGVVYRGLNHTRSLEGLKPGDDFRDPAFVSTSMDREQATDRDLPTAALMIIEVPKGMRVGPMFEFSESYEEREVLLPRNSRFRLLSVNGNEYRFRLMPWSKPGKLTKGYPEYDDTQARGEDGKWTAGGGSGGSGMNAPGPWRSTEALKQRFPNAETVHYSPGDRYREHGVHIAQGKTSGEEDLIFGLRFNEKSRTAYLDVIETSATPQGRQLARQALQLLYDVAQEDADFVRLDAGMESGGYVWPRLGFDVRDTQEFQFRVGARLDWIEANVPGVSGLDKVRDILASNTSDMGTRIARLSDPVPQAAFDRVVGGGGMGVRGTTKPTLGKLMLLGVHSVEYQLPRGRFHVLRDWATRL